MLAKTTLEESLFGLLLSLSLFPIDELNITLGLVLFLKLHYPGMFKWDDIDS